MYTRTVKLKWPAERSVMAWLADKGAQRVKAAQERMVITTDRQTDRRGLRLHNYATKLRLSVKTNVSVAPRLLFLPWRAES